jgi:hypothetical protein
MFPLHISEKYEGRKPFVYKGYGLFLTYFAVKVGIIHLLRLHHNKDRHIYKAE